MKQKLIIQLYFAQLCIKVVERKKKCGYCTWHSIIFLQMFNDIAFCYSFFLYCECLMKNFVIFLFFYIASVNDIAFCYFSHSGHCTGQ